MDATQQDPLECLPADDIVSTILHGAGLDTRLVCRKYRDLHPQLTALAPDGLHTPEELTAALASLPSSLTSLDLRRVDSDLLTPACLAAVATAAPRLEELKLARVPDSLLPAVLNTMSLCTELHTITLSVDDPHDTPTICWVRELGQPPIASRLRSLTLLPFLSALRAADASIFPHLTALTCASDFKHIPSSADAPLLVTLAAAAPALHCLKLDWAQEVQETRHLSALTGLTTLVLSFDCGGDFMYEDAIEDALAAGEPDFDSAPVLQGIACLTNLRHLQLENFCSTSTPATAGWHSRLTRLTHLAFENFVFKPWPHADVAAATSEAVAAAAQQLPALRSLALCDWGRFLHHPTFLRHLASATQLQRLSLELMELCPTKAQALSGLQSLTALELKDYADPSHQPGEALPFSASLQWVSTLTNLRQLAVTVHVVHKEKDPGVLLLGQALEPLLQLHTLKLGVVGDSGDLPYSAAVAEVLAAVEGRLERLQLGLRCLDGDAFLPCDSSLLVGLTRLRVLDVRHWEGVTKSQEQPLCLPPSLRRCYLPKDVSDAQLQQLQAAHPGVDYRRHERWEGRDRSRRCWLVEEPW